jgi:hypothetical protein
MWMDSKINNNLYSIRDKLVKEYLDFYCLSLTVGQVSKIEKVVGCLLNNFSFSLIVNNDSISITLDNHAFSKSVIYNGVDTGRKISYRSFKDVVNWMCEVGLATLDKGCVLSWDGDGDKAWPTKVKGSTLIASQDLIDMIKSTYKQKTDYPTIPDVIQVRDEYKNIIEKPLGRQEKRLLSMLNDYNYFSRKFIITVGEEYFDIQLRKVYNQSSFKKGGRSYVTGEGVSIMKRTFRKQILIDGNPTVEIDFKSLHPCLIAEKIGYVLPEGFDPYSIHLEGYDSAVLRRIGKNAFLSMFNAKSFPQAVGAVSKWLKEYEDEDGNHLPTKWKEQGLVPQVIEVKRILQELAIHNQYAQDWMFSGRGVDLQNVDSRIMDIVIQQFLDEDEFMLPVHDSIVVEKRLQDFGVNSMRVAYKQVLGTDNNCKIEIK